MQQFAVLSANFAVLTHFFLSICDKTANPSVKTAKLSFCCSGRWICRLYTLFRREIVQNGESSGRNSKSNIILLFLPLDLTLQQMDLPFLLRELPLLIMSQTMRIMIN